MKIGQFKSTKLQKLKNQVNFIIFNNLSLFKSFLMNTLRSANKSIATKKQELRGSIEQALKILEVIPIQQNNKWLATKKINSYSLRNDKASDIINVSSHVLPKLIINKDTYDFQQYRFLDYLSQYYKNQSKFYEFCHLLRHFSQWDYEFQFLYDVSLDQNMQNISLYLKCKNQIIQSHTNNTKKKILSGVLAQIQQWSKLARIIFKHLDERFVIQQFVQVVKMHYVQVKKNQNQRINGAQFFKICQIMNTRFLLEKNQIQNQDQDQNWEGNNKKRTRNLNDPSSITQIFGQSLLTGLSGQDRQLIRVLSCKDKNIAKLLQQKHNKQMVYLIGQEVDRMRKDIQSQKVKYLQLIQQKKAIQSIAQKIKFKALKYVKNNNAQNQEELLNILQSYNKKYNPHLKDVEHTRKQIQNKRIIQIIEREQLQP